MRWLGVFNFIFHKFILLKKFLTGLGGPVFNRPERWLGVRLVWAGGPVGWWCVRLGGWERRLVVRPPGRAGLSAGCASAWAGLSAGLTYPRVACRLDVRPSWRAVVPPGRWAGGRAAWLCVRLGGRACRLACVFARGRAAWQVGGRPSRLVRCLAWPSWQAGVPRQVGGRACRLAVRPSWRPGVPPGRWAGGRTAWLCGRLGGRAGVPPGLRFCARACRLAGGVRCSSACAAAVWQRHTGCICRPGHCSS